jgi:flavin-dependent dehydrogenase
MPPDQPFDCDILIAGAGPAGCAAAYDLARAGRRVLLLDKRTFPRSKACACGLTRKTLKALRYSVEPVTERVCHEIVLQNTTEVRIRTRGPLRALLLGGVVTRNPIAVMAVRERFDAFCLQQTLTAGAQLRKIESITALRETASGIELDITTSSGAETLRAPVLIGADGSNGQTRRLSEALNTSKGAPSMTTALSSAWVGLHDARTRTPEPPWYTRGFALEACVPYTDLPAILPGSGNAHDLVFDFAPLPGGYGWLFPKGDHINIGMGAFAPDANETQLKSVTRTLLADYATHKLGIRELPHITGQHLGMGGQAYIPLGRVLLIGDAAGLCDPLTGEGIHSAIVSGQAAAAAILECQAVGAPCPNSGTWDGAATTLAAAYAHHLRPLQQTLAFSHRAARAFYATPERGFRAMRTPLLRSLILKTYADGVPPTRLITAMAKLLR